MSTTSNKVSSETGPNNKVQAKTPGESHGSPQESIMTSTTSTETAQAELLRGDNRPPPTCPPTETTSATDPDNSQENKQMSSAIQTLTPYEPEDELSASFTQVKKRPRQRRNKNRKIREILNLQEQYKEEQFPRFFSMKFPRLEIETKLNLIAVDKDINKLIGKPAKIKKQNRDTLLIEVKSEQQGNKLKGVTEIAQQQVETQEHKSLNQSRGTVLSEAMSNSSLEELQEALEPQGVIKIERMKARRNGELIETNRYILTFNRPEIARVINITEWHHELVDLYIPPPMRCMNCQGFSHTKKWCRKDQPTCARCSDEGHLSNNCSKDYKCVNCSGGHNSMDKKCPYYLFKCEVLATQVRRKLTLREAEEEVRDRFSEEGKQFSFAARRKPASTLRQSSEDTARKTENNSPRDNRISVSNFSAMGAEATPGPSHEPPPPPPTESDSTKENKTHDGSSKQKEAPRNTPPTSAHEDREDEMEIEKNKLETPKEQPKKDAVVKHKRKLTPEKQLQSKKPSFDTKDNMKSLQLPSSLPPQRYKHTKDSTKPLSAGASQIPVLGGSYSRGSTPERTSHFDQSRSRDPRRSSSTHRGRKNSIPELYPYNPQYDWDKIKRDTRPQNQK